MTYTKDVRSPSGQKLINDFFMGDDTDLEQDLGVIMEDDGAEGESVDTDPASPGPASPALKAQPQGNGHGALRPTRRSTGPSPTPSSVMAPASPQSYQRQQSTASTGRPATAPPASMVLPAPLPAARSSRSPTAPDTGSSRNSPAPWEQPRPHVTGVYTGQVTSVLAQIGITASKAGGPRPRPGSVPNDVYTHSSLRPPVRLPPPALDVLHAWQDGLPQGPDPALPTSLGGLSVAPSVGSSRAATPLEALAAAAGHVAHSSIPVNAVNASAAIDADLARAGLRTLPAAIAGRQPHPGASHAVGGGYSNGYGSGNSNAYSGSSGGSGPASPASRGGGYHSTAHRGVHSTAGRLDGSYGGHGWGSSPSTVPYKDRAYGTRVSLACTVDAAARRAEAHKALTQQQVLQRQQAELVAQGKVGPLAPLGPRHQPNPASRLGVTTPGALPAAQALGSLFGLAWDSSPGAVAAAASAAGAAAASAAARIEAARQVARGSQGSQGDESLFIPSAWSVPGTPAADLQRELLSSRQSVANSGSATASRGASRSTRRTGGSGGGGRGSKGGAVGRSRQGPKRLGAGKGASTAADEAAAAAAAVMSYLPPAVRRAYNGPVHAQTVQDWELLMEANRRMMQDIDNVTNLVAPPLSRGAMAKAARAHGGSTGTASAPVLSPVTPGSLHSAPWGSTGGLGFGGSGVPSHASARAHRRYVRYSTDVLPELGLEPRSGRGTPTMGYDSTLRTQSSSDSAADGGDVAMASVRLGEGREGAADGVGAGDAAGGDGASEASFLDSPSRASPDPGTRHPEQPQQQLNRQQQVPLPHIGPEQLHLDMPRPTTSHSAGLRLQERSSRAPTPPTASTSSSPYPAPYFPSPSPNSYTAALKAAAAAQLPMWVDPTAAVSPSPLHLPQPTSPHSGRSSPSAPLSSPNRSRTSQRQMHLPPPSPLHAQRSLTSAHSAGAVPHAQASSASSASLGLHGTALQGQHSQGAHVNERGARVPSRHGHHRPTGHSDVRDTGTGTGTGTGTADGTDGLWGDRGGTPDSRVTDTGPWSSGYGAGPQQDDGMSGFGHDGYEEGYPDDGDEEGEGEGAYQGSPGVHWGGAEQDELHQRRPGEDLALQPGRGAVSYDGRATPSLSMWGNGGGDAGWPGHAGPRGGSLATSACPSAEHSLSHWPGAGRRSHTGVDRSVSGGQQQQQPPHGSASAEVSVVWGARDGAEAHWEGSAGHVGGSAGGEEAGASGSRSMGRHVSSGQSRQQPQGGGSQDGAGGAGGDGQEGQGPGRRSLESSLAASFASSYTPRGRDSQEGDPEDGGVQGEAGEGADGETEPSGARGGLNGSGASGSHGSVSVRGANRNASVNSSRARLGGDTGSGGLTGGGDGEESDRNGEDHGGEDTDAHTGTAEPEGDVDGVAVVAVAEAAPQGPVLTPGAGYQVVTSVAATLVVPEDPREAARQAAERELEAALLRTAEHSGKVKAADRASKALARGPQLPGTALVLQGPAAAAAPAAVPPAFKVLQRSGSIDGATAAASSLSVVQAAAAAPEVAAMAAASMALLGPGAASPPLHRGPRARDEPASPTLHQHGAPGSPSRTHGTAPGSPGPAPSPRGPSGPHPQHYQHVQATTQSGRPAQMQDVWTQ